MKVKPALGPLKEEKLWIINLELILIRLYIGFVLFAIQILKSMKITISYNKNVWI